jgi:RNA-binding protein
MLTGKQKRHLRALGHSLKPVILIGKNEIDDAQVAETESAIAHHELIKVKILESCLMDRHEVAEALVAACNAELAQVLGRTLLLYRKADTSVIQLPAAKE